MINALYYIIIQLPNIKEIFVSMDNYSLLARSKLPGCKIGWSIIKLHNLYIDGCDIGDDHFQIVKDGICYKIPFMGVSFLDKYLKLQAFF